MKKLFIVVALVCSVMIFTSCTDANDKCWELTYAITLAGQTTTATSYVYGSEEIVSSAITEALAGYRAQGISEDVINVTKKQVNKSKSDCKSK